MTPVDHMIARIFGGPVPHVAALGIAVVESGEGRALLRLPAQARLVGNPDDGALFGAVVTTLVDTACGYAAMAALREPGPVATLDLRMDFLRPALAAHDLLAEAQCYHVTRHVAFARATAWQGDRARPVATAQGTFMIAELNGPKG